MYHNKTAFQSKAGHLQTGTLTRFCSCDLDLDTQIWHRYSEEVPAHQKWSFYRSRLSKVTAQQGTQTQTQTNVLPGSIRWWQR